MWTPSNATDLENAARAGELRETTTFEAKAGLPDPRKNRDLAEDVCAMTVDGGVLIYGVGEDEKHDPTVPRPLELGGQRERIDQIVQTSIAEVPFIDVRALPLEADPARGYLAVVVPPSPRAPHQVTVGAEFRYYGRGATGNRRLSEGEVARLYQRREEWEVNRQVLLTETIAQAPAAPMTDLGYLHAFARPVSPSDELWERATAGSDPQQLLRRLRQAAAGTRPHSGYVPALSSLTQWARRGADVWTLDAGETRDGKRYLRFDLNVDGRGYLFVGRAAERLDAPHGHGSGDLVLFEEIIAGNLASFVSLLGVFYENAAYHGPVDLGVAVTGATATKPEDPLNSYRFSAKRIDPSSGTLDMGARRYGPQTSRFIQEDVYDDALANLNLATDPLTQNRYALAAGNPVSFIEVDGHEPVSSFKPDRRGNYEGRYGGRKNAARQQTAARKRFNSLPGPQKRFQPAKEVADRTPSRGAGAGGGTGQREETSLKREGTIADGAAGAAGGASAAERARQGSRREESRVRPRSARNRAGSEERLRLRGEARTAGSNARALGNAGRALGAAGTVATGAVSFAEGDGAGRTASRVAGAVGGGVLVGGGAAAACALTVVGAPAAPVCGAIGFAAGVVGGIAGDAAGEAAADKIEQSGGSQSGRRRYFGDGAE